MPTDRADRRHGGLDETQKMEEDRRDENKKRHAETGDRLLKPMGEGTEMLF